MCWLPPPAVQKGSQASRQYPSHLVEKRYVWMIISFWLCAPLCSRQSNTSSFTSSSLPLDSNPASFRRPYFSVTPRRRSRDGSSLNVSPMLTGLGPSALASTPSEHNLPRCGRFSNRSRFRADHGRPGKRARAGPGWLKFVTLAGDDNPPPDAAIIAHYNNNTAAATVRCAGGGRGRGERESCRKSAS